MTRRYTTTEVASRAPVAARPAPQVHGAGGTHPLLQLQQAHGNRFVQQWVQTQREAAASERQAGRAAGPGADEGVVAPRLQQDIQRARGRGRALPEHVRAPMEQALATDFSDVRLHTGSEADRLSQSVSAEAFTTGRDIFLRRGQADWASSAGRELIAHELTHVVQQRAAPPAAAPALGQPHDHHEREADRTAHAVATGHQVDAATLTPTTAPVVQRRYLNEGRNQGYQNWLDDTTVRKGLTVTSREKLTYVDMLLIEVLAQQGTPAWFSSNWEDLEALDQALMALKYTTNTTKTSAGFTRRQQAVQRLHNEIATRRHGLAELHNVTYGPEIVDLMKVGFVPSYLTELAPGDLDLLYQAHLALSLGLMPQAQALFDQLNPPVPAYLPAITTPLWAKEPYHQINQNQGGNHFDFQRIRDETMAAQRQLLAYHARTIGGDYGELLQYKPYKTNRLTDLSGANYFNVESLRSWTTVEQGGYGNAPSLKKAAAARADEIAEQSTQASRARGKNKPDKAPLTPSETAALRVYTSSDYYEMNAVFRDYRVDQPTANWGKYSAIAKLAISGMGKLPKARGIISYRGDSDTRFGGHEGVLRQGATIRLPNFYSTTKDVKTTFAGTVAYIFFNDRYGRLIERISTLTEGEVLLPPGATYRIAAQYDRQNQQDPWAGPNGEVLSNAARKFTANDPRPSGRRRILELVEA